MGRSGVIRRSAMFFTADAWSAAEEAAVRMWDHGLSEDRVQELTEAIVECINDYFAKLTPTENEA